jgi:hypothetical protein
MPFGEGSVLGRRYRLMSQVGRGGMGRVWHAHDDLLHRDVAVKEVIFPPGLSAADREVLYERTLREARSAARLSHPGIVTVHDVVEEDGRPWIVMEFVHAKSLQEVIDADGRLPVERVADIGSQMLAALRKAHGSGVLHRDVKPANVLLDGGHGATRVVITDFGIARVDGDATLTQTGIVLGSPAYIAPERARGEPAGPASDLWALGATLYAACEGRSPHDRVEAMAALTAVLHEEPDPPRHAGPLAPVLMGLLVKDPDRRMTAEQAATGLARAARGEVPSLSSGVASGGTPSPGAPSPGMTETWRDFPEPPASWTVEYGTGASGARRPEPDPAVREPSGPAPGPPRDPGAASRGRVVVVVVVVVVLLAAAAVAAVLLTRHKGHANAGPPPPSSAPRTPSPTPTPAAPAGYHRSPGPRGSSIAVPPGWTREVVTADSVRWSQPSTGAYIQVDTIPWKVADPVAHWRLFEREVLAQGHLPGFRAIRVSGRYAARGWPAADLEYTWSTRDHGLMRSYDRGFTAGGRQYALLVNAPSSGWSRYSSLPDTIFGSFEPG